MKDTLSVTSGVTSSNLSGENLPRKFISAFVPQSSLPMPTNEKTAKSADRETSSILPSTSTSTIAMDAKSAEGTCASSLSSSPTGNATKANLPERASEAPETARLEALESRCKALERQLTTANRDLKYAKSEVARVVNECSNAKKQHELEMDIQKKHLASQYKKQCQQLTKEHEEEMEKSREKLREKVVTVAQMNEVTEESKRLRKCNRELRQQINAFSTMLESAKDDGVRREKELNETIESLKAELLSQTTLIQYDLQPELDRLRSRKMVDSGEDRTDLRDTSSNSTSTKYILELRDQVLKLQAKSEAEKPLLKVGVAVRLSFLQQQNRHGADGHRKLDERALALKDGLAAARNGNGSADAALFEMGALTNTGELALVFEELYSSTPGKYPEWPHLVKQVVDLSVTLKTFKKCHKGHETNGLRQQHARIRTDIAESWTTASQHPEKSASFEQNESNLLKLKKLEWLTDEIVRFDSKENPTGHPRTLKSEFPEGTGNAATERGLDVAEETGENEFSYWKYHA